MSEEATPFTDAPAPFSGHVDGDNTDDLPPDLILRSSDGVDFHVHKDFLRFASPSFFGGMLTLPEGKGDPPDKIRDRKTIVPVEEPKTVLFTLLCLVYPAENVENIKLSDESLNGIVPVYQAARKYQFTRVQRLIQSFLGHPAILDANPLRVFAIAELCGDTNVAGKAALSMLKSLGSITDLPQFPEKKLISWEIGFKLHKFCDLYWSAARTIIGNQVHPQKYYLDKRRGRFALMKVPDNNDVFGWWKSHKSDGHSEQCAPGSQGKNERFQTEGLGTWWRMESPSTWFKNHINHLLTQIPMANLEERILDVPQSDQTIIKSCHRCSPHAERNLKDFARRLNEELTKERDLIREYCTSI